MNRFSLLQVMYFLVVVSILGQSSFAREDFLQLSNREPSPDEFGYRPFDGSEVTVTPPGFVWLPEEGASSYILQCSQKEDFTSIGYEKSRIQETVHCPPIILNSGPWFWRYCAVSKEGKRSNWSKIRSFQIAENADYFPQPELPDLLKRLPSQHPKLFLRPETVVVFRQNIEKYVPSIWARFMAHAESMLNDPVVKEEPAPYPDGRRGTNKENIDRWRHNRKIVTNAVEHAANLAFAYRLTGDSRFGNKAREWILAVVSWPPDGTTSYRYNDECGMPILSRIPRAYTWAYDALNGKERQKVIETMTARGREVYEYLRGKNHTVTPYESHRNRAWHFMSETAIAFIGDIPEARDWLQYAMDIFFNVYPVWSDDDGGWHEGVAYWNGYIDRIAWWMDIIKSAFRIDGYKKPFFKQAGDFPLYTCPPGAEFGGFGDSSDMRTASNFGLLMNLLADRTGNPYWKWYAAMAYKPEAVEKPDYRDLLRFRITDTGPKVPSDIPTSKVFHGTGLASLHCNLARTDEDVHLLFKSSPFGSRSHGFNAQNSFLLWAYGRPLLVWSGHRDWHGSTHHKEWMWETLSDNSITVNGTGQKKHSALAKGKIIDEFIDPRFDYVAGDATEAYDGRLTRFVRHMCFIKPRLIVIMDELKAPEPSTFEYHLHSNNEFSTKAQFEIETGDEIATARIAFVTPAQLEITQNQGHNPPSIGFEGTQWHLQAKTPEKVRETNFLTMIRPYPSKKVLDTRFDYGLKGNVQMFLCAVDNHKVLLFLNPLLESYTYGAITSNAGFMMMVMYKENQDESILFASNVNSIKMSDKSIFESVERDHYFVQWKDLDKEGKPKEE